MNEYQFKSGLGETIARFLEQKHAAGHPYLDAERILGIFDTMAAQTFQGTVELTREMCDKWTELRSATPKSLAHNLTVIRQLGKYMNSIGLAAYILPEYLSGKRIRYEPHIFSDIEKTAFFRNINQCTYRKISPLKCYVAPMIFRLLYCCGLRSSEALFLTVEDVDLDTGKVMIRESKGWKARMVFMSPKLLENMKEYNSIITLLYPDRKAFFPKKGGLFYTSNILDSWFHEFWDCLPEASGITGNSPRVHDWRHTMITDRINQWVAEDRNIQNLYIYLSEFVGHSSFSSLDYYIHLTRGFYPEIEKRMSPVDHEILPEVYDYEEN